MQINTNDNIANSRSNLRNATTESTSDKLGKNDFMNLFLTQMSHQDPTDPMDNGAMMTQISQMGSLEQLENINEEIKTLNKGQQEVAKFQALNAIGKDIMVETNEMEISKGSAKPLFFNIGQDADNVKVVVEDKDGAPVLTQNIGLKVAGQHQFDWDGKNDEGLLMGDGKYHIRFQAKTSDGTVKNIQAFNRSRVNNIEYKDGKSLFKTNGASIPYNKVKMIDTTSYERFGKAQPLPVINEISQKIK